MKFWKLSSRLGQGRCLLSAAHNGKAAVTAIFGGMRTIDPLLSSRAGMDAGVDRKHVYHRSQ
jgi:hypothetical protein